MKLFTADQIEHTLRKRDSETFGIYMGVQEIKGTYADIKVGRTVNVKAIQRGRSQGGANWWFLYFWPLKDKEATHKAEAALKPLLEQFKVKGTQGTGQTEIYSSDHQYDIYRMISSKLGSCIMSRASVWESEVLENGLVELPGPLLQELGWYEGDTLNYNFDGNSVYITKHVES
jgi:hypothetical protein